MKILLSISLLLVTSGKSIDIDLGLPEIHAVCKVTLNDGKTIEGFITFGGGGYEYQYRSNGFCLVHENGRKQLILYDFKFNLSNPERYHSYRNGTAKLCYVENISDRFYVKPKEEYNEENKVLTITKTDIEKYRLLEEMVIYKKIPLDLFLAYKENNESEKITIKVDEIKSVELLKNPSKNSLDIIEKARMRQAESEKDNGYWVDYQPPVWYHEIIEDQERIEYLSQYF
ncbi:hypothetical protein [Marinirhabdus gelatinilytica]|uniref:Uncharacterized protein n=1 Tax=Marinirhabdus gelatinilytica TaxID=1703343 RepID=A0A370Q5F5_9FLAO|nr:hypothetical protein [Marinirhabdus gelatinilytica]RDK83529.1 hypothetical protein C8D94_10766 [Marinirhabdus gelatinilytica]